MDNLYKTSDENDRDVLEIFESTPPNEDQMKEKIVFLFNNLKQFVSKIFPSLPYENNPNLFEYLNFLFNNQVQELEKFINPEIIFNSCKILSFVINNVSPKRNEQEEFIENFSNYSEFIIYRLAILCLTNLTTLHEEQINEIDISSFLKIIYVSLFLEEKQQIRILTFPIEIFTKVTSPFIFKNLDTCGLAYLYCLYAYVDRDHAMRDSEIILRELSSLKEKLSDEESHVFICQIMYCMSDRGTLPKAAFEANFRDYLTKLAHSSNEEIICNALLLVGKTIRNNGCVYEQLDYDFFCEMLDKFPLQEPFRVVLWILTLNLGNGKENEMIESGLFQKIVKLYNEVSTNSKNEIASFVCDILRLTSKPFEEFLNEEVLEIILNSLQIGDPIVVRESIDLLNRILYSLLTNSVEDDDQKNSHSFILSFLIDNDVSNIVRQLIDDFEVQKTDVFYQLQCFLTNLPQFSR